jgi:hypothetical protein
MMGARNAVMTAGRIMASTYREQVLELLEPTDLKTWKEALMTGVKVRDRTCMNLFAEMLKLVDRERDLVLVFVRALGYDKPEQLAEIVDSMRRAESMDEESLAAQSQRFLTDYLARNGKRLVILKEGDNGAEVS